MSKIKLGDKVRCKITGFTGIAVIRSEFLNGCVQYEVLPKVIKDKKIGVSIMPEGVGIDEQSLEILPNTKKKPVKKSDTGGAMNRQINRRNF